MQIALSPVETNRFGVVCARAQADRVADIPAIDDYCRANGVAMLTLRAPARDIALVHAIEAAGGRLMDTLVYYERALPADGPAQPNCRPARSTDGDAVARIARAAFTDYMGHYHADPRLDGAAATEGMVEWAGKGLDAALPSPYWVWEDGDGIAGFLMGALLADGSGDIVLNAVDPRRQKQGIYAALIAQACTGFAGLGCPRVEVSTQIQNYAVQKVWARFGFTHFKSLYTFHTWYL